MDSLFGFWGRFICHQLDERSFFLAGHKLPLCARCTGIYLGIFSSFVYLFFRKRFSGSRPISPVCGVIILICMAPLAFDGISSYFLGRSTTNFIRLLTGILFGMGIPIFYVFLYNFKPDATNDCFVIKNNYELAFILFIAVLMSFFIYTDIFIAWITLSFILFASVLMSLGSVFLIIRKLLLRKGFLK